MTLSIAVPLLVVGVLLALAVVVAALALRHPEASKRRVEGLFRRAPRPAKAPGPDHYYRPYWS
jgi:predicted outer membrane lipoprotein